MRIEDQAVSAFNQINWSEDDAPVKKDSPDTIKSRMENALNEFTKFADAEEATINGIVNAINDKTKNAEQKLQMVADNANKLKTDFEQAIFKMKGLFTDVNLL